MNAFEGLGLNENLVKAVTDLGFDTPTPIQIKAIPILLSGTTDFVGLAQTGTGKTAAFGLPLLQLVEAENKYPQALIVCPTRELCLQICSDLQEYKKYARNIIAEPVYGGASIVMQIRALKKGVHIVVATPERLIDINPGIYGIIFTRTKADAQDVTERLVKQGYDIEALHGDLTQQQRDK